jgi:hypothetical protein
MKKNVKNVAYIQDPDLLTQEQIEKYMVGVKNLTSVNPIEIYKFIVCCNKCYKITNFCLNLNSGVLRILIKLIEKNRKLDKCIFIATRSTADIIRKIAPKNMYFSLSSLEIIISEYKDINPFTVMTIVSDVRNAFYDQIYETGPKPAYRISELTVEKVNEFVDNGNGIDLLVALDDNTGETNEFEQLDKILLDPACKYVNFGSFINLELSVIPIITKLKKKLAAIYGVASNVSINGLLESYPDINPYTLYQNCAIQLVNSYFTWSFYIKNTIIFNRFNNLIKTKTASPLSFQFLSTARAAAPV